MTLMPNCRRPWPNAMKKALILLPALLWQLMALSQERCATMLLPQNMNRTESREEFESWLSSAKTLRALLRSTQAEQQTIYKIPVVFHVIHDGSNVGFGTNISDEKIFEQVRILNEDFRRTNSDATETLSEFVDVAADTQIEFVLAKQDPEGLPTNGIVRTRGSKDAYASNEEQLLMSQSYWPHNDYLNIYVTDISGNFLGYAQFPFSNLPGIAPELENYQLTDGLVLDYVWVGNNTATGGEFDSYGRTATHEIGHWLGLRHTWGDVNNCSLDDFCEDTPEESRSASDCELNKSSCGSVDMVQNYMNYAYDVCMNLFTTCQRERMRTVLELSPRRKSLLTSHGLEEPVQVALDLGMKSIVSPVQSDCEASVTPRVEVRNYGTSTINSFTLRYLLNGSEVESRLFEIQLMPRETYVASFNSSTLHSETANSVQFEVLNVNGATDENVLNNSKTELISPFTRLDLPFFEDFETNQNYHRITATGAPSIWTFVKAPYETSDNQAALAPFYNAANNFGVQDMLLTETLDLSGLTSAELSLNYAYAPRLQDESTDYYLDGLIIAISTNCGGDYTIDDVIFERYGRNLATTTTTTDEFYPLNSGQWNEIEVNISRFTGEPDVQVAVIGVNGGGNNLFVDDLSVSNANLLAYDMGIRNIDNVPVVTCEQNASPIIELKNYGFEQIDRVNLELTANGQTHTLAYENLNLTSGESENIAVSLSEYLENGTNEFSFTISDINDVSDQRTENNSFSFLLLMNDAEDLIPTKEDFLNQRWVTFSPDGINQFDNITVNGDPALYTNNFGSDALVSSWLVTPTLSTSGITEASLQFKYSYAQRLGYEDNLKVVLSTDCGQNFDIELIQLRPEQLTDTISNVEWMPATDEDWKTQFIDLTDYIGSPELRVAFVFTNGNGNRLFLDDINFYRTQDPDIPDLDALKTILAVYPNPAIDNFSVAFNLPDRQDINLQLVDLSGRIVYKKRYDNVLNDKLVFQAPSQKGCYILHVKGPSINQSKRIYIRR